VQLRFSDDSGARFGPVFRIAPDGALGHVDVVMPADGSAVVSWLQADTGGRGNLLLRRVKPDGDMGPVTPIADSAPARSVPQMAIAGDYLVLVWTGAKDDTKRVTSARIPIDAVPLN
jgi:hypothetical protein